jgi:U6 snRNA-associated Sm-like protein LSm8
MEEYFNSKIFSLTKLETVSVITCDGKNYHGKLVGMDQTTNIVLKNCFEFIYTNDGVQQKKLDGLNIIKGNNM